MGQCLDWGAGLLPNKCNGGRSFEWFYRLGYGRGNRVVGYSRRGKKGLVVSCRLVREQETWCAEFQVAAKGQGLK